MVIAADTTVFSDFPHLTFGIVPGDGIYLAWEETISGPAENGVHDMIGTGPIGQTVIRRARAARLIVAAVERAVDDPADWVKAPLPLLTRGHRRPWVIRRHQSG
jgi:hypothetical protein